MYFINFFNSTCDNKKKLKQKLKIPAFMKTKKKYKSTVHVYNKGRSKWLSKNTGIKEQMVSKKLNNELRKFCISNFTIPVPTLFTYKQINK